MSRRTVGFEFLFPSLAGLLLLGGCSLLGGDDRGRATPEVAGVGPTATLVAAATAVGTTPDATGSTTATVTAAQPTITASAEATDTQPPADAPGSPTPMPPATSEPAATPTRRPPPTGTPTATPANASILSFQASPSEVDPGDTVTLAWEATGQTATICPSARYELFTADDCREVDVAGTEAFVVPQEAAGFPTINFILTVGTLSQPDSATAQASVFLKCHSTWFFSDEPQSGVCPLEPTYSSAAAQRFERGTMIWLEQLGRYYVLEQRVLFAGEARKAVDVISDPLQVTGDTAAEMEPPDGLYAPQSGFGLIWRGDVAQSSGYGDRLGWALAPEFGYDAVFQCDDAPPSGGQSWRTCHLQGPDGRVIVFHPLGGWYFLGEQ